MAILKVHKLVDSSGAITYASKNKVAKIKDGNYDSVYKCAGYTMINKAEGIIVYETINSTINCSLLNAAKEFKAIRVAYGKDDKIKGYHIFQNFGVEFDPQVANEIGRKFVERHCPGFQAIISTHTNTAFTHNHIVLNSVSFETGMKYYSNTKSYREARKISDDLCYEYDLPVIEHTKDHRLSKYLIDGKVKFYEPTERKKMLGKYKNFENNSEFNQHQYVEKKSNVDEIREVIDSLLPSVNSYDDLIAKLISIGCEVRSRKKDGSYMKHISFKLSDHEKSTRDKSLGDFYTRESLEKVIEMKFNRIASPTELSNFVENILEKIDNEGPIENEIEEHLLIDVAILNSEIDQSFWSALNTSYDFDQNRYKDMSKRDLYYAKRIDANLRSMKLMNDEKMYSLTDMKSKLSEMLVIKNATIDELKKATSILKEMGDAIVAIEKLEDSVSLTERDKMLYRKYLKAKGLSSNEKIDEFKKLYEQSSQKYDRMVNTLSMLSYRLIQFDDVVSNISRIENEREAVIDLNNYNQDRDQRSKGISKSPFKNLIR